MRSPGLSEEPTSMSDDQKSYVPTRGIVAGALAAMAANILHARKNNWNVSVPRAMAHSLMIPTGALTDMYINKHATAEKTAMEKEAVLPALAGAAALGGKLLMGGLTALGLYEGGKGIYEGVKNRNLGQAAGGALTAGLSVLPFTGAGKAIGRIAGGRAGLLTKGLGSGKLRRTARHGLKMVGENMPYIGGFMAADAMMGRGDPAGGGMAAGFGMAPMGPQGMGATGSPTMGMNVAQPYQPGQMQFGQMTQQPAEQQQGFPWKPVS